MEKIELGSEVQDVITGYKGIAVSRTEYLYGCAHIGVRSREFKDGQPLPVIFFEEPQCKVIAPRSAAVTATLPAATGANPGGPSLSAYPSRT